MEEMMIQMLLERIRRMVRRIAGAGGDGETSLLNRRLQRGIAAQVVVGMLVLFSAQAQAQSIVGTWIYTDPTLVASFTFQANGRWSVSTFESILEGCPGPSLAAGSYTAS